MCIYRERGREGGREREFIRVAYGCGSGGLTMAGSHCRSRKSNSCSVHKAGHLKSPNLALEAWGIPGELLSSVHTGILKLVLFILFFLPLIQ